MLQNVTDIGRFVGSRWTGGLRVEGGDEVETVAGRGLVLARDGDRQHEGSGGVTGS